MRLLLASLALVALSAPAQQPFTIQQALSAPYSTNLTASPVGATFAWVEHVEGRNNLWIGEPGKPARELTHNTEDDAQDITSLAFSPDGSVIAYVFGAQTGASGKPANPAHLQRPTPSDLILQPVDGSAAIHLGEGRSPVFMMDPTYLLFIRGGQIVRAPISTGDFCDLHCSQENPARKPTLLSRTLLSDPKANLLVFDRGSASSVTLSPDGRLMAYISHRRTHSFLALYDLQAKTLTFPAPSTGNDSAPLFSRDGNYLAWLRWPWTDTSEFATNRVSPNPWSVQLLDVATSKTRMLYQPEANKPGSAEPRMSTGEPRLMWGLKPTTHFMVESEPQRNAPAAGGVHAVSFTQQHEQSEGAPPIEYKPWLLFFGEADGYIHLYGLDPASSNAKPIPYNKGAYEVEDAIISPDGHSLYFASNKTDTYSGKVADALDIDRRHIYSENVNPDFVSAGSVRITTGKDIETHPVISGDGKWMAELVSSSTLPMHVQFIECQVMVIPGGSLRPKVATAIQAHNASINGYPEKSLTTPQQVIFPASDKLFQLHGQLFMPKAAAAGKRPAILFFHGGPRRQLLLGYPSMDYYSNAYAMNQYLASRGYIVLSVNYRGGIGYGLNFRQCEHCGGDGAAEYADALGAVAYLKSRPDVDASRIGIWGGSYGGYFTALGLARNSDLFAAGVDFHGVHEWAREDNAPGDWLRSETNDPDDVAKIAKRAHESSPMADVDKWKSPVLFIHGDDDPDVAYIQTPMLADALRARKVHVEELIFPDELHGFILHKDWVKAYEATAEFFDRTLKGQK